MTDEDIMAVTAKPGPESNLSDAQLGTLMSPIHRSRVATRSQSGATLSYVEAYDVKATLIRIFGFGGFSAEVIDSKILDVREGGRQGVYSSGEKKGQTKAPQVIAQSTVRLTIFGIGPHGTDAVYTETAVGSNNGTDIGETCDNAIKTAASDALKRCAIYLGDQFGLSLYRGGSTDPLVRVLFAPGQSEQWARLLSSIAEEPVPDQRTQDALNRAMTKDQQ